MLSQPTPMDPCSTECVLPRFECKLEAAPDWQWRAHWVLGFGWPAGGASVAPGRPLADIDIDGVMPERLQSIQVRAGSELIYSVDSSQGRGGQVTTAGDLVFAIASQYGRPGLWIAAEHLRPGVMLNALNLQLRVHADEPGALCGIQVRARSR